MLKNEKENFFLSATVVAVIAGFLIWQGIINANNGISDKIRELKDKKVSASVYSLKEKFLDQEREAYDFSKSKLEKINNYFVYASDNDDMEFTSFFGQLDNIAMQSTQKEKALSIELYQDEASAAKSGGSNGSSSQKAVVENNRLFKLTLNSDFGGLLKFISYLEAMPYYVYIESVNTGISGGIEAKKTLNKNASGSGSVNLKSVLIIRVFRKTNIL